MNINGTVLPKQMDNDIDQKNGFLSMFNLNKCFNVYNYKSMLQIK